MLELEGIFMFDTGPIKLGVRAVKLEVVPPLWSLPV